MNNKVDQWLAFIDDYDRRLIEMAEQRNKTLKRARIEMNYLTGEAEERRLAELREKWEMDSVSTFNYGKRLGMQEGIEKGMQKGRKKSQLETAKKLLKLNIDIKQIQEITELTKEEIENLISEEKTRKNEI